MQRKMVKIFGLVVGLLLWSLTAAAGGINIFAYSRPAPETKIYDAYGKAENLQNFGGDFVIAVFWSKKCIPCIRELDNLNRFANKTKDDGIKVILISAENEWNSEEEQKNFLAKYGAGDLAFFVDKNSDLAKDFGIFTSPHAVLIDDKSMEIGRIRGAVEWDDEDVIEEIYRIKAEK